MWLDLPEWVGGIFTVTLRSPKSAAGAILINGVKHTRLQRERGFAVHAHAVMINTKSQLYRFQTCTSA